MVMDYVIRDKTSRDATRAIEYVGEQQKRMEHKLKRLASDREPPIVIAQEDIEVRGVRYCRYEGGWSEGWFIMGIYST